VAIPVVTQGAIPAVPLGAIPAATPAAGRWPAPVERRLGRCQGHRQDPATEKENPIKKVLEDKVLPEKKTDQPVSGLLYFAMEKQEDEGPGTDLRRPRKPHRDALQVGAGRARPGVWPQRSNYRRFRVIHRHRKASETRTESSFPEYGQGRGSQA